MGCKNSKVTPLKTPTPPPDFRRVSERRSGGFSRVHEPRHLAREAEDLILLDVDESDDDDDSFGDEAIRRYLGDDEARRGTPNHHRPSVPRLIQRIRPPTPGIVLKSHRISHVSSSGNSPASSLCGSPRSSPSSSPEPGYASPCQTGVLPPRSSTPHPDMPGVEWFLRQEGSEMTRLPADISRVLAPRPSRANTTADDDDEPSITELCIRNQNIRRARMFLANSALRAEGSSAGRTGSGTNIRAPTRRQVRWAELPNISD